MIPTARGTPALDSVCEKHNANLGFRLRAEYVPGEPPFPDSPEEAGWLAKRETLLVTVLRARTGWIVLTSWTVGGQETSHRQEPEDAVLKAWAAEMEECFAWQLPAFAACPLGDAWAEFEHEAYEYFDEDPDSLDLDSWRPPRRWRVERSRSGGDVAATRALLAAYRGFLPAALASSSPLASSFAG